jgi:hypothetical protein
MASDSENECVSVCGVCYVAYGGSGGGSVSLVKVFVIGCIMFPQKSCVEVLSLSTSECDWVWS